MTSKFTVQKQLSRVVIACAKYDSSKCIWYPSHASYNSEAEAGKVAREHVKHTGHTVEMITFRDWYRQEEVINVNDVSPV